MSVKIHHGWKIQTPDLSSLILFFEGFRARAWDVFRSHHARAVAARAALRFDCARLGLTLSSLRNDMSDPALTEASPIHGAIEEIAEAYRRVKAEPCRDPQNDWECEADLYPGCDTSLLLLHAEQSFYAEILGNTRGVEHYPYWDNTDRPEDVSEREWKRRGEEWKEAIGPGAPPRRRLRFELIGRRLPRPDTEAVLRAIPSPEDRLSAVARVAAISGLYGGPPKDATYHDIVSWLVDENGFGTAYNAARTALAPHFTAEIQHADLACRLDAAKA